MASIPQGMKLVFATAHEGHAVDAFRHGAVDYVLKPFDEERIAITLGRLAAAALADAFGAVATGTATAKAADVDHVTLNNGRTTEVLPVAKIAWIEALHTYTRVQAAGHQPGIVRRTMQEWEEVLS